ncbi:hypothetical protein [Streptosporangium sp. CA-115845]|uniref:hypothetical protein n=1 Tax=Streptosporangium sp. CA-115845 TaxID=3240071 RepID=UPI003D92F71A
MTSADGERLNALGTTLRWFATRLPAAGRLTDRHRFARTATAASPTRAVVGTANDRAGVRLEEAIDEKLSEWPGIRFEKEQHASLTAVCDCGMRRTPITVPG